MSSKIRNLSSQKEKQFPGAHKYKIAIAVSEYHEDITFALRDSCVQTLKKCGVKEKNITVRLTPGAFELPLAAQWLHDSTGPDAVIILGCVIKGETAHDEYINHSVAHAVAALNCETGDPFIFGLLTVNTLQQAKDRAGGKYGNKGTECALAALKMLELKGSLR